MTERKCNIHENHDHQHGKGCGHTAIKHNNHVDYLHDGHLHHVHDDHIDEHIIEVSDKNPNECRKAKACGCAPNCGCDCTAGTCDCDCTKSSNCCDEGHVHGPNCGHEAVPHGDHICYLVNGRLHFPHGDHCDDHGPVEVVA